MSHTPTLHLAAELIARASVTPVDGGCLELMAARLAPLGFRIERMDRNGVSNLWARRGEARPLLCFAGHTDVVPPGPLEQWHSDPFVPTVRESQLYGRGAADMKSSLAAFVTAIEAHMASGAQPAGSIALLLTSDEEGDALDGTVRVIEALAARGETIDYCVVGEPTCVARLGDTIKNGRRGSLSGRLVVRGQQGHIAYPHLARNPVHLFAPALAELGAIEWDAGDSFFPPTTWQVSNLHCGTGATNVIPGTLEVLFNFRFNPISAAEILKQRVHEVLDRHGLDYRLDWTLSAKPYFTRPGRLLSAATRAVEDVCGLAPELSTSGGTSDGRFIADVCAEVIELGPMNATIHKIDECIPVADLEPLARIYRGIIEELLG